MSMTMDDPFYQYVAGLAVGSAGARMPCPLDKTEIDVVIDGGFATVETSRTFRNHEQIAIEAVLTFPVPIDAVMHDLAVTIDGRRLKGKAIARNAARESYEQAIDDGKTAILHEEVLRGVHTISVAQLVPGKACTVTSSFSTVLARGESGNLLLRIPTTVGEVYGRLPLNPADDIVTGGRPQKATLRVTTMGGSAHVIGENLAATGDALEGIVDLGHAIDIALVASGASKLAGVSADGRGVSLVFVDRPSLAAALDLAVVFDRSGSTGGAVRGDRRDATVWSAMRDALGHAFAALGARDTITLYQFDDSVQRVGRTREMPAPRLLDRLSPPGGGTEIGIAIEHALAHGHKDVLVLTDGRSGALDVHGLARRGARISALLVGPASLEAMIGHLASLTGGQLACASGADARDHLPPLLEALRAPPAPAPKASCDNLPDQLSAVRSGRSFNLTWGTAAAEAGDAKIARGLGAYAAALALSTLTQDAAMATAIAHNLTTHLTSLLVVDETGEAQDGIPAMRKVALPEPYAAAAPCAAPVPPPMATALRRPSEWRASFLLEPRQRPSSACASRSVGAYTPPPAPAAHVAPVVVIGSSARQIDWDKCGHQLARGDIHALSHDQQALLIAVAKQDDVRELARNAALDPLIVAVAIVALGASDSRTAKRVVRTVAAKVDPDKLLVVFRRLQGEEAPTALGQLWGRLRGSDTRPRA